MRIVKNESLSTILGQQVKEPRRIVKHEGRSTIWGY